MLHVERQLAGTGLHDAAGRIVGSRCPVLQILARPDEGLHERALEVVATARRRQQDVRAIVHVIPFCGRADSPGFVVGQHAAPGQIAGRKPQVDVRRSNIRIELVCVEVLARLAAQLQVDRLAPVNEVLGSRAGDPACSFSKHAEIAYVLLLAGGPERIVLRVERAFGDHGIRLELLPVQSVGGCEGQ